MQQRQPNRVKRTDRVGEQLKQVVATGLERIDDERLQLVTVTSVDVEPDLRHAQVYFSSLSADRSVEEVAEILLEHRVALQQQIAKEVRMKRTPQLAFVPDPSIDAGWRVEQILQEIHGEDSDPHS